MPNPFGKRLKQSRGERVNMLTNREPTETDGLKQFLVQCEGCSFEHAADDRDEAMAIGTDHQQETRHEVVALEVPPALRRA